MLNNNTIKLFDMENMDDDTPIYIHPYSNNPVDKINNLIAQSEDNIEELRQTNIVIFNNGLNKCNNLKLTKLKNICDNILIENNINTNLLTKNGYPYYGKDDFVGYLNNYTYDGLFIIIIIGSTRDSILIVNSKFNVCDNSFVIKIKDVEPLYIYFYLNIMINFSFLINRTAPSIINKSIIENIDIPIPPLHIQHKIVNNLDTNYVSILSLQNSINKLINKKKILKNK